MERIRQQFAGDPAEHFTEDQLQEYALEGLPPDGPAALHLQNCPQCMEAFEAYCRVMMELKTPSENYALPGHFSASILKKIDDRNNNPKSTNWLDDNLPWLSGLFS